MDWILPLQTLYLDHPIVAAGAYMVLYAVVMMAGLPGGIAMLLLGGFVFGNATASTLALTGAAIAAAITYPLAKGILGRFLTRRIGEKRMASVATFVERQGIFGLLIVRMIPLFPFAGLNLGLSVAKVRWWPYILTTVIGTVPIAWLVTRVGSGMQSVVDLEGAATPAAFLRPDIIGPLLILIAMSTAGLLWKRRSDRIDLANTAAAD